VLVQVEAERQQAVVEQLIAEKAELENEGQESDVKASSAEVCACVTSVTVLCSV
jgi:hypothetical protein